jgi:hypothetical protein
VPTIHIVGTRGDDRDAGGMDYRWRAIPPWSGPGLGLLARDPSTGLAVSSDRTSVTAESRHTTEREPEGLRMIDDDWQ